MTFERLSNRNRVTYGGPREQSTGNNVSWVRVPYKKKNELEKEIDSYEQVIFPPRPAGLEGGHEETVAERERQRRE